MKQENTKYFSIKPSDTPLVWKFPHHVDFEKTTGYLYRIRNIDFSKSMIFDLTETEIVHSSFIGFMIDVHTKLEHHGGSMIVKLSSTMEKQFSRMNLYNHFQPEQIHQAV